MSRFSNFGNDLYTGRRSIEFVGRVKRWYLISAVLLAIMVAGLMMRGINFGIEFTGGSDFRIANVGQLPDYESRAAKVVTDVGKVEKVSVTRVGGDDVRIQTERFDDRRAQDVRAGLAKEFKVTPTDVQSSVIGPSWGQSVSKQALQALLWFLGLVSIVLAVYFRTWKMSLAALVALAHDIILTVGIYSLAGFEVTPASMIGFLTILGYSLYDTVVVFDKVRENTTDALRRGHQTYSQAANQAVNQTLVRSINTSVVALLPVAAILIVGATIIGPGTLLDLALALFVGIIVGTYSSIFIATPMLAQLREREPAMIKLRQRVERHQAVQPQVAAPVAAGAKRGGVAATGGATAFQPGARTGSAGLADGPSQERTLSGRPVHPYAQRGPRNQPKRPPRSKR
ncbi:protein translocase subunit SecF [Gephyromycinifex aptenodytis]|uniref:protein translocase subunit SecF n=1 Tax=Gephyromycinifex aptenodytis TaxID=2716227 RepID=UPI001444F7E1|nr:protein translocase subunit SecF [Gephyromycinifex aptenodytis]